MFRFKKKLTPSFFSELQSYIDTYTHIKYSDEHTQCVEEAFDAIDDYYVASYALAEAQVTQALPPDTPVPEAPQASPKPQARSMLEHTADLSDITKILKQPSFADNLFRIIDEKGLKDSKVYKKADIDRRLFSKIRSDSTYHPSKETAIKLCLALELDIVETEKLLETAGYCLSMSSTGDLVIRYCIEHKEFSVTNINEALDYFSVPLI